MSVRFHVYLREYDLPSRDHWQREIDRHGIHLTLDEFSTREHTGFLRAKMNGAECGFEYSFQSVDETATDGIPDEIGNRDKVVTFIIHGGRELDCQAAMLAAAVLTELTNRVYDDPRASCFAEGQEPLISSGNRKTQIERVGAFRQRNGPVSPADVARNADRLVQSIERRVRFGDLTLAECEAVANQRQK
jgi:hypothetical protein